MKHNIRKTTSRSSLIFEILYVLSMGPKTVLWEITSWETSYNMYNRKKNLKF